MFQKVLKGIVITCLASVSGFAIAPMVKAQTSVCPSVKSNVSIQSQVNTFMGTLNLGQFPGIQVVILASMGSMDTAQETSKMIDLEFQYSKKFRQAIVMDARKMGAMRGMILEEMKKNPSRQPSKNTSMAMDFDGNSIRPLIATSEKLFSNVNLNEDAVLLILDGNGKVLSAYNKIEADLPIRMCLREQLALAKTLQ